MDFNDRHFPWSFLGVLLAVLFGVFGVYTGLFYARTPQVRLETLGNVPVLSVREEVKDLVITFAGEDIRRTGKQLSLLTFQIRNSGRASVKTGDFDLARPLEISVDVGRIIRVELLSSSSPYLQQVLGTCPVDSARMVLPAFILEPNEYATWKVIVLHPTEQRPLLRISGKVAGVGDFELRDASSPSPENRAIPPWSGGLSVQLIRVGTYGLGLLLVILAITSATVIILGYARSYNRRRAFERARTARVARIRRLGDRGRMFGPLAILYELAGMDAVRAALVGSKDPLAVSYHFGRRLMRNGVKVTPDELARIFDAIREMPQDQREKDLQLLQEIESAERV